MDTFDGLPPPGRDDDAKSKRIYQAIAARQAARVKPALVPRPCTGSANVAACCRRHPRACSAGAAGGAGQLGAAGKPAAAALQRERMGLVERGKWNLGTVDEVRANMRRVPYPSELLRFVVGKVEVTLHDRAVALPERIAMLRLDTDWHDSTREELEVLWPRLERGGLLVVDDYFTWGGARKAVDAWLRRRGWSEAARQPKRDDQPWHVWKEGPFAAP